MRTSSGTAQEGLIKESGMSIRRLRRGRSGELEEHIGELKLERAVHVGDRTEKDSGAKERIGKRSRRDVENACERGNPNDALSYLVFFKKGLRRERGAGTDR